MLLAIDIENKTTSFAVFDKDDMLESFAIATDRNKSMEEIRLIIKLILADKKILLEEIDGIIISTVVPELYRTYEDISKTIIGKEPILISAGVKTGLNIKCENPKEVGSDRIIRAVAGSSTYKSDIIIIYASTITTIDYINSKKEFQGGVILPGIDLLEKSLFNESAKLPQVEIRHTEKILGNNTTTAIQSGIYNGYKHAIAGIVDGIIAENKLDRSSTTIITTGPHAKLLENDDNKIIENLGLMGLKIIFDLNNPSS